MSTLATILRQRAAAAEARAQAISGRLADHRSGTLTDQVDLEAALDDLDRYTRLQDRLGTVAVRAEARTYRPDGAHSFFRDLADRGSSAAAERLDRHRAEHADLEQRDIGTGAFAGLTVPQYLVEQVAPTARAGRVLLDQCTPIDLPATGMTVELGRITTAPTADAQTTELAPVSKTDAVSTALSMNVRTITGAAVFSRQVNERAGTASDLLIASDLLAAVNAASDSQAISADGTSGQHLGILSTGSITSVTYTDASPTALELILKLGAAVSASAVARKVRPTHIFMHTRRWAWLVSRAEAASIGGVSLVIPPNAPDGCVGTCAGCWIMLDDNIPTNLGAGTDEDRIIVCRAADLLYGQSAPTVLVDRSSLAGNLGTKFVPYVYAAFTAARYPAAVAVISGTGLNATAT